MDIRNQICYQQLELLLNYSDYVCFKLGEAVFHIFINTLALNVRSIKLDLKSV